MKLANLLIAVTLGVALLVSSGLGAVVNFAPVSGARIEGSVGRLTRALGHNHGPKKAQEGEISVYVHDAPIAGSVMKGCGGKKPENNGGAMAGVVLEGCNIVNSGPLSGTIVHGDQGKGSSDVWNSGPLSGAEIFGNVGRVARAAISPFLRTNPGTDFNSRPVSDELIKGDLGRAL